MSIKKLQTIETQLNNLIKQNQESKALKTVTLKQLKRDFDCDNLKEAEELLKSKQREKEELDEELEEITSEIEKQMEELELI